MNPDGTISKDHFLSLLKKHGKKIKLVAVTGASNVTGYINDIDFFAFEAHKHGAKILVDGAQLVPHRPVDMRSGDSPYHIDYLVFSGHKIYAPFGVGVLVVDKETFEQGEPDSVGGGVVDIVTLEEAYWTDLPDKEEAGTPDIIGVVALGKAIKLFQSIGWEAIIAHETELTSYALRELNEDPGSDGIWRQQSVRSQRSPGSDLAQYRRASALAGRGDPELRRRDRRSLRLFLRAYVCQDAVACVR